MRRYSKPIRKYLQQVRVLLPCSYKEKQAILSMLNRTLYEFVSTNPTASYETIRNHFGEPEEIVRSYCNHSDPSCLLKKWNRTNRASCILLASTVVLIIVLCIVSIASQKIHSRELKEAPIYINQATNHLADESRIAQHIDAYKAALALLDTPK